MRSANHWIFWHLIIRFHLFAERISAVTVAASELTALYLPPKGLQQNLPPEILSDSPSQNPYWRRILRLQVSESPENICRRSSCWKKTFRYILSGLIQRLTSLFNHRLKPNTSVITPIRSLMCVPPASRSKVIAESAELTVAETHY